MNKRNATSGDVAALAGVSQSTVSRSFDPGSRISKKTRERVFEAAESLGYQVNKAAQTMIKQRSDLVGLVTADLADPFRSEFLNGLIIEIQLRGLRPMVIDVTEPATIDSSLQRLLQYQLSGVIVTSGTPSETVGRLFLNRGTPVILVNRADLSIDADIVNIDNHNGAALAAKALLKAERSHLVVVRAKTPSYGSVMRAEGFWRALEPAIQKSEVRVTELHCESGDYDGGYQVAEKLLSLTPRPDGVFFCMDYIACGFMDAARQQFGISIPDDISVVGFDDIQLARYKSYDLTTVRQSAQRMSKAVLSSLLNRLDNPDSVASQKTVPVELIYRNTL